MKKNVIVLGARGRFGRSAVKSFADKGWKVTALARRWDDQKLQGAHIYKTASAFDSDALSKACMDHDVIVNAINPPYQDWKHVLSQITQNVIAAGLASGATIMIPGNIYNYGNELPAIINEDTPHVPNFPKGRLRIEMEQTYREAARKGLRTIVLRSGDYFENENTSDWFQSQIANKLHKGIVTYPGPLNMVHSWAYLPDKARIMASLAEKRFEFAKFEEFIFRGYAVTGQELIETIGNATGQTLRTKTFPWTLLRFLGLFSEFIREVIEMQYLWNRPHEIDDAKLRNTIPEFRPTPFGVAIQKAVGASEQLSQTSALAKIATNTTS
ncbi:MAG: NAD(P)H-binding protein [Rhizobiaceae bacterium]|nr:NAD(P)H-binding protein [Rhizobiaceae bacterium]